jgi:hypothetical protein
LSRVAEFEYDRVGYGGVEIGTFIKNDEGRIAAELERGASLMSGMAAS